MKIYLRNIGNKTDYRQVISKIITADFVPSESPETILSAQEKQSCNFLVYILTPLFTDLYAIAELIDDAIKYPDKTLFCFEEDSSNDKKFSKHQIKSMNAVAKMVINNNAKHLENSEQLISFLQSQ